MDDIEDEYNNLLWSESRQSYDQPPTHPFRNSINRCRSITSKRSTNQIHYTQIDPISDKFNIQDIYIGYRPTQEEPVTTFVAKNMSLSSTSGGSGSGKRKRNVGDGDSNNNNNNRSSSAGAAVGGDTKTTLASLLKYMEGYEVIVELKMGRRHRGRLTSADDNMNLMLLEEVVVEEDEDDDEEGQEDEKEDDQATPTTTASASTSTNTNISTSTSTSVNNNNNNNTSTSTISITTTATTRNIRGSSVRYVHFPDNADLSTLIQSGRERERNAARKFQKTTRKSTK